MTKRGIAIEMVLSRTRGQEAEFEKEVESENREFLFKLKKEVETFVKVYSQLPLKERLDAREAFYKKAELL